MLDPIYAETEHKKLIHVHVCKECQPASKRNEPEGVPNVLGIFHCARCGYEGPLNVEIIGEDDARLLSKP